MREAEEEVEEKPIDEILRNLFEENGEAYEELTHLLGEVNQGALQAWLNRLTYMKDFKAGLERNKWLVSNILKYLKLANDNSNFRQIFSLTIQEAASTCGDRMALPILHLGIQHQLMTIKLNDLPKLADFLSKGVWAMGLLEEIARKKVETISFVDEIEIFLAYPVKLKNQLELPIDIEDMLYYHVSEVTEKDLQMAGEIVLKRRNNKEELYKFLVSQEKWREALKLNFSQKYFSLEKARNTGMQSDEVDYTDLEKNFHDGLVALTKKALDGA